LIGFMLLVSISAAFMSLCMLMLGLGALFPLHGYTFGRLQNAFWWTFAAVSFATMCPGLWVWGRRMACYKVLLDAMGVEFRFGTKKSPQAPLRMNWDQIKAIQHRRVEKAETYTVLGNDGSSAQFSSYTFFRPKKLAKLIAARASQSIQEI
jgi:hypothetical protein